MTSEGRVSSAWQVVLYNAVEKHKADLPCWCGNPFAGHAGWLVCAEREVERLTAPASTPSPDPRDTPGDIR